MYIYIENEKPQSCIQSVNYNLFVPLEKSILDSSAGCLKHFKTIKVKKASTVIHTFIVNSNSRSANHVRNSVPSL